LYLATALPSGARLPDCTPRDILQVAIAQFPEKGLADAGVGEIGRRISASRRMVYCYFKSKLGPCRAVPGHCYLQMRQIDTSLAPEALPPLEALREAMVGIIESWCRRR
jgi:AcrR family transcriptional regulator